MSSTLTDLFQTFLEERRYLKNVTATTLTSYQSVWKATAPYLPSEPSTMNQAAANALIVKLRESGKTAGGCNVCIRTLNAFWKWMAESGYTTGKTVRLKLLRTEQRVLPTYSKEHISTLVSLKPDCLNDARVRTMFLLAVDTGARLNEIRLISRTDVNLDQCLVKLYGKGRKERVVPFSVEARKVLYTWMRSHDHAFMFATRTGTPISCRNAQRDLKNLFLKLKLPLIRFIFHSARRTFATTYARHGDVFRLQATLGHASLQTTQRYVNISTDDLKAVHGALSPLSALTR
jgi:integrase/recombinase XerD